MELEIYANKGGKHSWRLRSSNGQTVASAGESFASRANASKAGKNFCARAAKLKFEIYADKGGKNRWRALSTNGQTVGSSGQPFATRSNAVRAANNVRDKAGTSTVAA